MKKNSTKIISIISALLMILTSMPLTVLAATGEYEYKTVASTNDEVVIEITHYNGTEKSVEIPATIDGYRVVGISGAFIQNKYIEKINIPEGIEYLMKDTFYKCANPLSISLPSTLKYIGANVFTYSSISKINIPENLEAIDSGAFAYVTFEDTDIVLPESFKYLSIYAFDDSNITSIYLPENLLFVGNVAYNYSTKYTTNTWFANGDYWDTDLYYYNPVTSPMLSKITISASNPYYKIVDNTLYTRDMKYLLCYPNKEENKSLILPNEVECISGFAFYNSKIDTLKLNEKISEINDNTFYMAKINTIDFGKNSNVKTIGESAFEDSTLCGNIIIPHSVQTIGARAFRNCELITSVYIPNSVTLMGYEKDKEHHGDSSEVFRDCVSLESIKFEDNSPLTYWGTDTFTGCTSLKNLNTGKNNKVVEIYSDFSNCKIETLDLSNCSDLHKIYWQGRFSDCSKLRFVDLSSTQILGISDYMFKNCPALEEVILPDTATYISGEAFANCINLNSINLSNITKIDKDAFLNTPIDVSDFQFDETEKLYDNFKYRENSNGILITEYIADDIHFRDIIVPDYIDGKPVVELSGSVFKNKKASSIKLPSTLKRINGYVFYGFTLKSELILPESLTYIGAMAFERANISSDIIIPSGIKSIYESTFRNCTAKSITLNDNLSYIGKSAFEGCNFESLIIPDSVNYIGENAFKNCEKIKTISFGKNITDINMKSLFGSLQYNGPDLLEKIMVSKDNTNYSSVNGVLYNKNKTVIIAYPKSKKDINFEIPNTVTEIAKYCFTETKYTQYIILPDGLKTICDNAFYNNHSLCEITFPSSLTKIDSSAFENCDNLLKVQFEKGIVLDSLIGTFCRCKNLKEVIFASDINLNLLSYTFMECINLKFVVLPDNLKEILNHSFSDTAIEEINLPKELEIIGDSTFANTNLKKVIIPKKVEYINTRAFQNCSSLSYINLSNVKGIGYYSFAGCTALENIDLTGVTYVSSNAFDGCTNLKKFYFTKDELEAYIAENEFKGNETLETIVVGNSITSIEDGAFADCTNLETALIAQSVKNIADTAFDNCDNLSIVCAENSYAQSYAERNAIPYTTFTVAPIKDQKYTGYKIEPELNVSAHGKNLSKSSDYITVFENNINIGTAKVNVLGLGDYSIFACLVKFNIVPNDDIPHTDEECNPDINGGSQTDNGKDNEDYNKADNTHTPNKSENINSNDKENKNNSNGTQMLNKPENVKDNVNKYNQDSKKNNFAPAVGSINQGDSNNTYNGSENSSSANSEKPSTSGNEKVQNNEKNGADGEEEKTADKAENKSGTDNTQDNKKKLSFWQRLLNIMRNFFYKLIDIIKKLFV